MTSMLVKTVRELRPEPVRQLVGVHKLQHDRRGAGYRHIAFLPSPHRAQVTDTQQCGQLRLGEAVSLADGFDFGGGHDAAGTLSTGCTVSGGSSFENGLHHRVNCSTPDGADDEANCTPGIVPAISHGIGPVAALEAANNLTRAAVNYIVTVGHLTFSLVRWGIAPFGRAFMRAKCPIVNTQSTHFSITGEQE